jgi:hypothetical protein
VNNQNSTRVQNAMLKSDAEDLRDSLLEEDEAG